MSEMQRLEAVERNQDKLFDRVRLVELAQSKTDQKLDHIKDTLVSLVCKVDSLKDKPSKRWDIVVATMITVVITVVVTTVVNKVI